MQFATSRVMVSLVPVTSIGRKTIMMTLLAVEDGEGKLFISGLVYDQDLLEN